MPIMKIDGERIYRGSTWCGGPIATGGRKKKEFARHDANIGHAAHDNVQPDEAEQVILTIRWTSDS